MDQINSKKLVLPEILPSPMTRAIFHNVYYTYHNEAIITTKEN